MCVCVCSDTYVGVGMGVVTRGVMTTGVEGVIPTVGNRGAVRLLRPPPPPPRSILPGGATCTRKKCLNKQNHKTTEEVRQACAFGCIFDDIIERARDQCTMKYMIDACFN